jgi:hypothetical protein
MNRPRPDACEEALEARRVDDHVVDDRKEAFFGKVVHKEGDVAVTQSHLPLDLIRRSLGLIFATSDHQVMDLVSLDKG